ncbi:PTS transporter subunit EIIC [Peribacillus frigoritolerans]|nr:PTS transporter subunit EIIC [Peribacillus frigoritolerans]
MDQYGVLAGSFLDAFVYLGGSGATLGLIIAMIIAGRKRYKQMIALGGGAPGVFQINEPILFRIAYRFESNVVHPICSRPGNYYGDILYRSKQRNGFPDRC